MGREGPRRGPGEALLLPALVREEVPRQIADVLGPFAQGRELQCDDVEPVEEIGAEPSGQDLRLEIPVGRRDEAVVHLDLPVGSHRGDPSGLEDPQQRGLELQGHVPDLVQEEGPPVGLPDLPGPALVRAGERAPLVAEELAGEEVRGDCGAVDRDEGSRGPGAAAMEELGDHLLAGAALPGEEHGDVAAGDPPRVPEDQAEGGARRDDPLQGLRGHLERGVLAGAQAEGVPHRGHELVQVHGLRQVVHRAELERSHRVPDVGVGGHQEERQVRLRGPGALEEIQARVAGHPNVGDHHVHGARVEHGLRGRDVRRLQGLESRGPEGLSIEVPEPGLVIYDEHPRRHVASFPGATTRIPRIVTRVPRPSALSRSMSHPCCSTIRRTIARPIPWPPSRPVT